MKLTSIAKEKLRTKEQKDMLASEVCKGYETIKRWIYSENHRFNNKIGIKALKKVTGLTKDQIFEKEEITVNN